MSEDQVYLYLYMCNVGQDEAECSSEEMKTTNVRTFSQPQLTGRSEDEIQGEGEDGD